jgi:hypothetical protein
VPVIALATGSSGSGAISIPPSSTLTRTSLPLDSNINSATAQTAYYAGNEFAASDHDPIVVGFNPLLGDFDDDGELDSKDLTALRRARGQSDAQMEYRRMDMDHDGIITQDDFLIWQSYFITWQQATH